MHSNPSRSPHELVIHQEPTAYVSLHIEEIHALIQSNNQTVNLLIRKFLSLAAFRHPDIKARQT